MITILVAFTLGAAAGFALRYWQNADDMLACTLADHTSLVRWWHRHFGHGETGAGICWACGRIE